MIDWNAHIDHRNLHIPHHSITIQVQKRLICTVRLAIPHGKSIRHTFLLDLFVILLRCLPHAVNLLRIIIRRNTAAIRISIHNVFCSSLPVTVVNAVLATSLLNFQPVGCAESGSIICIYFTEVASLKFVNVIVALSSAKTAVHIDSTITAATNNAPIFLNKFFIRFAPFFLCIFLFRPSSAIYN